MIYPDFLQKNDILGYVAPSFGCAIEPYRAAFARAREVFAEYGYGEDLGSCVYASDGIGISSTPQACAAEFVDMYVSEENSALISCGGGELMCEILPHMDFKSIYESKPKWFMGYSDNTNLTFLLTTALDIASIYGPCVSSFGMDPWHQAIQDAFDVLRGDERITSTDDDGHTMITVHNYDGWEIESGKDEDHPYEPYHISELFIPVAYGEKSVSGRLAGGCLDCLSNLVGTKFDRVRNFNHKYGHEGILWFLESCDLNVMDMRRSLWNLREAGWFDCASGFLIGRPMHFDEPMFGIDRHEAVKGAIGDLGVPIYMDLDIGHLPPMMPIVCGSYGKASVKGRQVTLEMVFN